MEQALTDPRGLPGRPWFKNLISAPGTLTGYGAKSLPAIREGIEQNFEFLGWDRHGRVRHCRVTSREKPHCAALRMKSRRFSHSF